MVLHQTARMNRAKCARVTPCLRIHTHKLSWQKQFHIHTAHTYNIVLSYLVLLNIQVIYKESQTHNQI